MSSTAVMNVLRYSKARGVARLVLIALAAHCNDARADMRAWPTITRLAQLANVHRPGASNAIKQLIESGELQDTGEKIGRNPVYKITLSEDLTVSPQYDHEESSPYYYSTPTVSPQYDDRTATVHKLETTRIELETITPLPPSPANEVQSVPELSLEMEVAEKYDWKVDAFAIFWDNYFTGRKTDRPKAEKAFRKAAKTQDIAREIIHGVMRHGEIYNGYDKNERCYIPHATTWLNGERWTGDDPRPRKSASGNSRPATDYRQQEIQREQEITHALISEFASNRTSGGYTESGEPIDPDQAREINYIN
jgi:hypothetical protein